jgi:hypothetical protein
VSNIKVNLRLDGKAMASHKVMRTQGNCLVKSTGQNIELTISKLEDFCAVNIQMRK